MWGGSDGSPGESQGFGGMPADPILDYYSRSSTLSREQMAWLTSRLSVYEKTEIQNLTARCLSEVNITRGLPCSVACVGGLYLLKKRKLLNVSPVASAITFGVVPVLVALVADSVFMKTHPCSNRVREKIRELYDQHSTREASGDKTSQSSGGMTYARLREANRSGRPIESLQKQQQQRPSSVLDKKLFGAEGGGGGVGGGLAEVGSLLKGGERGGGGAGEKPSKRPPVLPPYFGSGGTDSFGSSGGYMSGTPSAAGGFLSGSDAEKPTSLEGGNERGSR